MMYRVERIDPSKTAVIVVDMENDFVAPGAPLETHADRGMQPHLKWEQIKQRRPPSTAFTDLFRHFWRVIVPEEIAGNGWSVEVCPPSRGVPSRPSTAESGSSQGRGRRGAAAASAAAVRWLPKGRQGQVGHT
jgi:hypothetical protein